MALATVVYLVIGTIAIIGVLLMLRNNLQTSRQNTLTRTTRTTPATQETSKTKNPYGATSIVCGADSCTAASAIDGKRFLIDDTPQLPLSTCDAEKCDCKYAHHEDRRDEDGSR